MQHRLQLKSLHLILIFALLFTVGAQAIQPPALASDTARPAQQGEAAPVLLDTAPANGAGWDLSLIHISEPTRPY